MSRDSTLRDVTENMADGKGGRGRIQLLDNDKEDKQYATTEKESARSG